MKDDNMDQELENLTFEQALQELENLVRRLEEGRLPLEEAIQSYERGTILRKQCEAKLKAARLRVEQITIGLDGEVAQEPFQS